MSGGKKMKLSLCITHYERSLLLRQCVDEIHERISEVVIQDDCSSENEQLSLHAFYERGFRVEFNDFNLGMSRNKAESVRSAENDWCIVFDSDNIIRNSYIEALPKQLDPHTIYCPDFAEPNFNYTRFAGKYITRHNVKEFLKYPMFDAFMNTCNYVVNRKEYLRVYEYNETMKATDSVWFFYLWLKAGNSFYVVPNMRYFHRVHPDSGFLKDAEYNMQKAKQVRKLIEKL